MILQLIYTNSKGLLHIQKCVEAVLCGEGVRANRQASHAAALEPIESWKYYWSTNDTHMRLSNSFKGNMIQMTADFCSIK